MNEKKIQASAFGEITQLIQSARQRAYHAVNTELVNLYWQVGQVINRRIESDGWGKGTIESLSDFIRKSQPGIRGFSAQNLWRMRQFHEAYQDQEVLSPLVRELPWTHHMHLGKLNFYLEALERDHRKDHENPPVGMLLCASKDEEVVEYALSRSLSPAMVAEYQLKMPDKEMLKAKLHEFYQRLAPPDEGDVTK